MNGGSFLFLFIVLLPIIYIVLHIAEWKEKADKYDAFQDLIYSGYVKNLEEILREKEAERISSKIDKGIESVQELLDLFMKAFFRKVNKRFEY